VLLVPSVKLANFKLAVLESAPLSFLAEYHRGSLQGFTILAQNGTFDQ
jgi:hypothetical protein